jgi:hypothetical protein
MDGDVQMIRDLEELGNHTEREQIWDTLVSHKSFPECCRYTWSEMERFSDHQKALSFKSDSHHFEFRNRFNAAELRIIDFMVSDITRESKVSAMKVFHKSAVQKCQRLTADIRKFVEETEAMRTEFERHMSKRLALGLDVEDNMKKRFN